MRRAPRSKFGPKDPTETSSCSADGNKGQHEGFRVGAHDRGTYSPYDGWYGYGQEPDICKENTRIFGQQGHTRAGLNPVEYSPVTLSHGAPDAVACAFR